MQSLSPTSCIHIYRWMICCNHKLTHHVVTSCVLVGHGFNFTPYLAHVVYLVHGCLPPAVINTCWSAGVHVLVGYTLPEDGRCWILVYPVLVRTTLLSAGTAVLAWNCSCFCCFRSWHVILSISVLGLHSKFANYLWVCCDDNAVIIFVLFFTSHFMILVHYSRSVGKHSRFCV